jgi:Tol biopolymer transport system component
MGEVYRARDPRLGRDVALKVLPPLSEQNEAARQRLRKEARSAASLDHPYICKVFDVGEEAGLPFIAMEYVPGETLAARLAQGPLPLTVALRFATEIAEALQAAHREGLVHRDLKPANVMIAIDGHVRVLDFGIAARITAIGAAAADTATRTVTSPGSCEVAGTLAYMSPEQLRGLPADARSDVFAFGLLLYELLAGVHPFAHGTGFETGSAILHRDPQPWPAGVQPAAILQHIVRKALAKDPAERYQSIQETLIDLRAVATDTSVGPLPAAIAVAPVSRRFVSIALAVAVIAAGASAGWWAYRGSRTSVRPAPSHAQVTFVGNVATATLSPDGKTVAYVTDDGQRLMVQDVAGGASIEVGAAPSGFGLPAWSPDGSEISVFILAGSRVMIPRLGGPQRPTAGGHQLTWSPDRSLVATSSGNTRSVRVLQVATQAVAATIPLPSTVFINGLDWGLASNRIAIRGWEETGAFAIWVAAPDGSEVQRVFSDANQIGGMGWSPFGDVLYVSRIRGQAGEVIALDSPGRGTAAPRILLSGMPESSELTVSRDGRSLLTVRRATASNLILIDLDDLALPLRRLTEGTREWIDPRVSPDNRWIAASIRTGSRSRIVRIPIDGGAPVFLTAGDARDTSPAWSPDGRHIAFGSDRGGASGVWLMTSEGRDLRKLEVGPVSPNQLVTWTPTGDIAWQQTTERSLLDYRIRSVDGGPESWFLPAGPLGWVFFPRFSPAGDLAAVFWNRAPQPGLWVFSWPGRSPRLLGPNVFPVGWSRDGGSIYGIDSPGMGKKSTRVLAISARTGEASVLATLQRGRLTAGDASPDGTKLVLAVDEGTSDAWLATNFDPRVTDR